MAKDGGDFIASWAFYIHEIGIGALHQALLLTFPRLLFWRGMKTILCERHVLVRRSSLPERVKRLLISWLQTPSAVVLEPPEIKPKQHPVVDVTGDRSKGKSLQSLNMPLV